MRVKLQLVISPGQNIQTVLFTVIYPSCTSLLRIDDLSMTNIQGPPKTNGEGMPNGLGDAGG
jgi:hypothetical protein